MQHSETMVISRSEAEVWALVGDSGNSGSHDRGLSV